MLVAGFIADLFPSGFKLWASRAEIYFPWHWQIGDLEQPADATIRYGHWKKVEGFNQKVFDWARRSEVRRGIARSSHFTHLLVFFLSNFPKYYCPLEREPPRSQIATNDNCATGEVLNREFWRGPQQSPSPRKNPPNLFIFHLHVSLQFTMSDSDPACGSIDNADTYFGLRVHHLGLRDRWVALPRHGACPAPGHKVVDV
ncbi:hypothetical protein C8F04DRAFT_676732 [Mycena alexandri]|uniref:Uncharacterized protein n=1 Tax=Mycena alexandri TaxID=1745969 RepID=A0AAD6SPJ6_9AGAR|nr:hypothetical protein C8F04DRAFT_676732 [Mycena alexandri]